MKISRLAEASRSKCKCEASAGAWAGMVAGPVRGGGAHKSSLPVLGITGARAPGTHRGVLYCIVQHATEILFQ